MNRKNRVERYDSRDEAFALIERGNLTASEIEQIKATFTGLGGLYGGRWSHGQFFTPDKVVKLVHDMLGINAADGEIMELAAGAGAFFNGIGDQTRCTGIEPVRETFKVLSACYPSAKLYNSNAEDLIQPDKPSEFDSRYKFVIGNPPFGLDIPWCSDALTGGKMKKAKSEAVFTEMAVRCCAPGGLVALVVCNNILSNDSYAKLRESIMKQCFIRASIQLPRETFYHSGTSVITSILVLQKAPEGFVIEYSKEKKTNYSILFVVCDNIGWDSRGRDTGKCDLPEAYDVWLKGAMNFRKSIGQPLSDMLPLPVLPQPPVDDVPDLSKMPLAEMSSPQQAGIETPSAGCVPEAEVPGTGIMKSEGLTSTQESTCVFDKHKQGCLF